ncbi:ABC transporter ATP-binding protein [candidate division KSB3 bacterium]|uniref:ABC transporter ATP-binding protein n=1 Tax=candidate division KSB3 bacterium TaxID=2044937 RepID=A0A2G6KKG4_9BACT|nr:MAG: ABC transporter ATP-binding protein [candidate division KSB3 bacterium]
MGLLEIRDIEKDFGGLIALHNVSFDVNEGEIVSVIGPNGAGKTTLFNCITGYIKPDKGQIHFLGKNITGFDPYEVNDLGMARTFQQIRLFMELTIMENVLIGMHSRIKAGVFHALLKPRWVRDEEAAARAKALEILGLFQERLLPRLDQRAKMLSYANRRRLEIARALASEPKLMLLDEPAAGMNPRETQLATDLIGQLRNMGHTILLIEHDMRLVMSISDRVIVLDHGEKIAEGTPVEIQNNEQVIEAYMGRAAKNA